MKMTIAKGRVSGGSEKGSRDHGYHEYHDRVRSKVSQSFHTRKLYQGTRDSMGTTGTTDTTNTTDTTGITNTTYTMGPTRRIKKMMTENIIPKKWFLVDSTLKQRKMH